MLVSLRLYHGGAPDKKEIGYRQSLTARFIAPKPTRRVNKGRPRSRLPVWLQATFGCAIPADWPVCLPTAAPVASAALQVTAESSSGGKILVWLYRYSTQHPKTVIAVALFITLAIAPGVLRLQIRTDGHALVPKLAPEIRLDRAIRDEFATEDPVVVLIRADHPDGIFNAHTVALVEALTGAFRELEGVRPTDLFSLATEYGHRVRPGTLHVRRLLEPLPDTAEALQTLRDDLRAIELFTGTLVSLDENATAIMIGVPADADRTGLVRKIRDIVRAQGELPERIDIIGAPVAEALLGTHILEDLGVPSVVLGYRTRSDGSADEWRVPRSLYELRVFIGRHVGLVPVAIAIMAFVFLVSFRSVIGVALPLVEVGACLAVVFGLMGWIGVPVYLTIAVLPVILTAIGVADEIHITARYIEELRARTYDDHRNAVLATMEEMTGPVVKTSVTTAVGFLSFALSPIGPVQAFGIFTAIGIIFCMLWSLSVIPACLTLLPPRRFLRELQLDAAVNSQSRRDSRFGRFAASMIRYRYAVLALAGVIMAAAPLGVKRIVIQDSWIDGFAPDSEFFQATDYFNQQFLGSHILLLCLDTHHTKLSGTLPGAAIDHHTILLPSDAIANAERIVGQQVRLSRQGAPPQPTSPDRVPRAWRDWVSWIESAERVPEGILITVNRKSGSPRIALRTSADVELRYEIAPYRFMRPETLTLVEELEDFVESHRDDAVGGAIGTADLIKTANLMARGLREDQRRIPDESEGIKWVWSQYERIRGKDRRQQVVDSDYARALVTVFMKDANFVDTKHLMADIRGYESTRLRPRGVSLEFAGDVAVSQTLIDAIVTTQIRSLLLSLVGVLAVTTILGRSIRWGLLCVLPCAAAVLVNFAVMGIAGVPLGVATSMFAGMTLGIGVDYAIHLLERYQRARQSTNDAEKAIIDAVAATGPAILIDALAVALGFGVLMLSQVPANARLAGLVVLSITGCFAATLLLLPALLRTFGARRKPNRSP